ncbi:alpha/beta fold hydrolase [Oxalobacteraceae bacterium R-40]|uniref:Alpha/beta fold hydrolase n=1 Tax=Keguizhuia sedimenti TaxID=3064264 RepID=A0ABU1BML5_9BURK|nr:alpha/beta fold hydrolase [Oxalobacteraceae bacterium R-40]
MITRITRLIIAVQLLVALLICIALINIWHVNNVFAAFTVGIGLVILIRLTIIANNFFISLRYRSVAPEDFRLTWKQVLRLFATEFFASMLSSHWTMAFCSFDKRIADRPVGLPALLIHGYGCNSGYWHSMSRLLLSEHITHYAVDLEPVFADIDEYAPLIDQALAQLCRETGQEKAVIVAHSMGGLVARAYIRKYGTARIAKVITLGTPHRGTGLANFGTGLNSQQMQWQGRAGQGKASQWLEELEASEDTAIRSLFVSIYSHHDNIISPQTSSHLAGAENIELAGIGHVSLAMNPEVQKIVIAQIKLASQHEASAHGSVSQ